MASAASGSRTNYRNHPGHHSNSEGATSPNESDNTYAEASLLAQPPMAASSGRGGPAALDHRQPPIRYGQYHPSFSL